MWWVGRAVGRGRTGWSEEGRGGVWRGVAGARAGGSGAPAEVSENCVTVQVVRMLYVPPGADPG